MSSNIRVQRICQHCGNDFTAKTTVTKYCGDPCAKAAYKKREREGKITASNVETKAILNRPIDQVKSKEFLSLNDTALLTGLSVRTVMRLIQRGSLKAGKVGRRTIIKRQELEKIFQ